MPTDDRGPTSTEAPGGRARLIRAVGVLDGVEASALPAACLPALLDDVESALTERWPDYAQFLRENRDEVAAAAEPAVLALIERATAGRTGPHGDRHRIGPHALESELFEHIGRIQCRDGHELPRLLSAYRAGAQVLWRQVSTMAVGYGAAPDTVATLAQAVFGFVDQLCSASARGYAHEQSASGPTRLRRREELAELLLSDGVRAGALQAACDRAGWPLPARAGIVLLDPDEPCGPGGLGRLDADHLPLRRPTAVGAVLPDPERPGRRHRLVDALRGTGAVIGPAVPPHQLSDSLPITQLAAGLRRTGIVHGVASDDPVFVDEHLDTLIVHQDPELLRALRERELAPLQAAPASAREWLRDTLVAWLRHRGNRQAVAAELHVHPQTVRYRLTRLRELFGTRLDDPHTRTRLHLALVWGGPPATATGTSTQSGTD